jgi:histidyl-tRNA synthetase
MSKKLQSVKGMNDLLPETVAHWQYFEEVIRELAASYGYREIRFPIVEPTALFKRSVGEVTDIVEKEMYVFDDRNGESLALRPEGTAGCVRAGIQHGLLFNQIQKLWYQGPLFRYERPQKGRYRQFHQVGFECFGLKEAEADVELISMAYRLLKKLGLQDNVRLEINSLGTSEERKAYREELVTYYQQHVEQLDEDSKRRLESNPLRILDSKNSQVIEINKDAPKLLEHLGEESKAHFERVCELLTGLGIAYQVNPKLVRGLDYYCHTVFEFVTENLGAQGTVCAGGRYDGLVEQLGDKPTPAVGFALGVERMVELLAELQLLPEVAPTTDVYFVTVGEAARLAGYQLAEQLRDSQPGLKVSVNSTAGNFKKQFKRADQSGARVAVVIAEDELEKQQVAVKFLREDRQQELFDFNELAAKVVGLFS